MKVFFIMIGVGLCFNVAGQDANIGRENIQFIDYPDFPEANSTWGDIGYNSVTDAVYIGVTNHKNKIGFYEYSVGDDKIRLKGFVNEMAHLRDFQWQGKIHSKITTDPDGNVYFATDGENPERNF